MDRDIKAVIQRLKLLEKPYYREKYGTESQETSRRIATELFRGLLIQKEKKLSEINSENNLEGKIFNYDVEETEEIRMEKYKSKKHTEERKKARDLKNREE
jgi:hypothetical protein